MFHPDSSLRRRRNLGQCRKSCTACCNGLPRTALLPSGRQLREALPENSHTRFHHPGSLFRFHPCTFSRHCRGNKLISFNISYIGEEMQEEVQAPLASGKPWFCVKNRREAVFPKVDTPYGQALTGLRVQAPLGARVLSSMCCAPNDGFGPQSGLVHRGILYAAWRQRKPYNRPDGRGNAFPLWWLTPPPFPLFEGAQQPVLTVEMLMKRMFRGVLFCPPDGVAREHDS